MMTEEHMKCLFCEKDAIRRLDNNTYFYTCPRCGMYNYINSEHNNIMTLINKFYKCISYAEKINLKHTAHIYFVNLIIINSIEYQLLP